MPPWNGEGIIKFQLSSFGCKGSELKKKGLSYVIYFILWGRGEVYTWFWWGNLRGKRLVGRPRRRWEFNIKINLQEV
jgi:hypothetical protein